MDPAKVGWRKSSRSGLNGCVEVAFPDGDRVTVRDSKNKRGLVLEFVSTEWDAFVKGVRDGQFDLPLQVGRGGGGIKR
jgi:hypothetical protein